MIQEIGLPLPPLLDRVQAWCERDLQQQVERAAATQLQQTAGLRNFAIGGPVGAALAELSWAWLQQVFSHHAPRKNRLIISHKRNHTMKRVLDSKRILQSALEHANGNVAR